MATFIQIATTTVGSGGAADITFSSIPATYTDLLLLTSIRTNRTGTEEDSVNLEFNGVGTAYTRRNLRGNGASASSLSGSDLLFLLNQNADGSTASTFSNASIYIPNYAGSTNKSVSVDAVSENNATTAWANLSANLWSNTAAITSIKLTPNVGPNFMQYSTATLYGISKS